MQIDIVRFDTVAIHGRFSHCTTKIYPKNCAADIDRSHSPPPPHTHTLFDKPRVPPFKSVVSMVSIVLAGFRKGDGGGGGSG